MYNKLIFEDFFDELQDDEMIIQDEVDELKMGDSSDKLSLYVIFYLGQPAARIVTSNMILGNIEKIFDSIKKVAVNILDKLSFVYEPDVQFYTDSYYPEDCDIVGKVGNNIVHYKNESKEIKPGSFGVKFLFDAYIKNFNQCFYLLCALNKIFDIIRIKNSYTAYSFIVKYNTDNNYMIDCDIIKMQNISNNSAFNKLSQTKKNYILSLLRQVCDIPDLASQMYKHYNTNLSNKFASFIITEKTKKIFSSELIYGNYDIQTLLDKFKRNSPDSNYISLMTMDRPSEKIDVFLDMPKFINLCNEQKVSFTCQLRDFQSYRIYLLMYSTPILYDNREFVVIISAQADYSRLKINRSKPSINESTLRFYELIKYCKFNVSDVLDFMIHNNSQWFDKEYKNRILGYLK